MNNHIPSLDGIRGIAALIVFTAHIGLEHIVPGGFGVTVFFFLSGFLITSLLVTEHERTGTISLRNFYLRRVYRIFPPMYLVFGLALLIALIQGSHFSWAAALAQALHLTNYVDILGGATVQYTGVYWSLAVEEHFYLVFPLALLLMLRRHNTARTLAILCAVVLAWRFVLALSGVGSEHIYHASDTRIDSILYGCILALWRNPMRDQSIRPITACVLLGIGGALLIASLTIRDPLFRDTLRYTLQGLGLMPVFYCAVRFHRWPLFRWLDSAPLRAMGLISYTFYLCHLGIIRLLESVIDSQAITAVLAFLGAVSFSAVSYWAMERPLGKLRHKLHTDPSHALPDPAPAALRGVRPNAI